MSNVLHTELSLESVLLRCRAICEDAVYMADDGFDISSTVLGHVLADRLEITPLEHKIGKVQWTWETTHDMEATYEVLDSLNDGRRSVSRPEYTGEPKQNNLRFNSLASHVPVVRWRETYACIVQLVKAPLYDPPIRIHGA